MLIIKKRVFGIILIGLFVKSSAFCVQSLGEEVTLNVGSLPGGPGQPAMTAVLNKFRERYPHIKLTGSSLLRISGQEMDAAPLLAIAGGTSPDVIYVNFRQSDSYIQQNFLYPLDEFIAEVSPDEIKTRIPENVLPVVYREGPDGKEHYWALPTATFVSVIFYNRLLFQLSGLDPEKGPYNWDDFFEACIRITDPAKGIYGFGIGVGQHASYYIFPFLNAAGGDAVAKDAEGNWHAVYDSETAVETMYLFNKLRWYPIERNGKVYRGVIYRGTDVSQKWGRGEIGIIIGGLGDKLLATFTGGLSAEITGVSSNIVGPSGNMGTQINCQMWGIYSGVKDPKVRRAAWEYIHFLDSPEAREIYTRTSVSIGHGRFMNPALLKRYGFEGFLEQLPRGWVEAYEDGIANSTPEPYGRNCQQVYTEITKPMDEILSFDLTRFPPDEAKAKIRGVLKSAAKETNRKMLGIISPPERQRQNRVSLIVLLIIVLVFGILFSRIWREFSPRGKENHGWQFRKYFLAYLVLVPAVLSILVWQYYPLLRGMLIAFQDYVIVGKSRLIGLNNFSEVIFDKQFWIAFMNSIYFAFLMLGFTFFPPLVLAIFLQEVPRGKILYRIIFYLPAVISSVVVIFLWRSFFEATPTGLLNRILKVFNVGPYDWILDPKLAMLCVVMPIGWASMGPGSILYLAGLKNVPDELYEAAEIDGAGFFRKVWTIAIPTLMPLIIINLIGTVIAAFKSVDYILAMTGGGPGRATQVLGLEIFVKAFLFLKFGVASAMAWILGAMLVGFTAHQLKTLSRAEFRAEGG